MSRSFEEIVPELEARLGYGELAGKRFDPPSELDVFLMGPGLGTLELEIRPHFRIYVGFISFEEGSLYSWIRGRVEVLSLGAALLAGVGAFAGPPLEEVVRHDIQVHRFHQRIEEALKDQPMVKYRGFRFDDSELGQFAGDIFNFKDRGISDDERRRRTALVQLALKVDLGTTLSIDGEYGPDTLRNLAEFGKKYHHPPSVNNPFLQADLMRALKQSGN